jgi:predicted transcriptional regulator
MAASLEVGYPTNLRRLYVALVRHMFFVNRAPICAESIPLTIPSDAPRPLRAYKAAVYSYAERLSAQLGVSPGDPMDNVVARLGGKIVFRNPTSWDAGPPESMVVHAQNDFTIFLPSVTSLARDRFTIAHELGHLFLHYPQHSSSKPGIPMRATRWVDETDSEQQRAEWEANWFAAAFLMPTTLFREAWKNNVMLAASRFGVSSKAAEIRAKDLRLL